MSEVDKLVSHQNTPIIVTNLGDYRFDEMKLRLEKGEPGDRIISLPTIKIPKLKSVFAFPFGQAIVELLIEQLLLISNSEDVFSQSALVDPSQIYTYENIRQ